MKKVLLLATLALGLAACGQNTPHPNVSGTWSGTMTGSFGSFPATLRLTQSAGADDFSGTIVAFSNTLAVSGKVSTGEMAYNTDTSTPTQFKGVFTPTTYKGTLTYTTQTGTFSFTKQAN